MSVDWWSGGSRVKESLYRLPLQPYAMVGRQRDLNMAEALILRGEVRLVTIVGPPGVGKTRFALELASRVASRFDQGAVFVDLAPLRDAGLVLDLVARVLGGVEHLDRPVLAQLQRHLRNQNLLLILDNFEHVIAAAADLADLLEAGPQVKLLVTSRQPLHIRWEYRYNLPPLALPDAPARLHPDTLARYSATALFMERVRMAETGFSANERNASAVVEICHRLDGLPLAIELAAAWTAVLGPEAVLSGLSAQRAFPLGSSRDAPERQRTLFDAVAWSYDLLNEAERRVFRALGAFAGETPLEAIEAVCEGLGVDVLTPVAGLVDKNLLLRVGEGETHFRMLETIRSFAEEQLERMGEADVVRRRHAAWFLALARRVERFIWSEHQAVWLLRLERAHDNVRLALNWCFSGGDEETGALLVAAMHRFWFARGYIREGRRWNELAASKRQLSDRGRALALRNLAFFLMHQGEVQQALGLAEQAAALARSVGEPSLMAWVLHGLALAMDEVGDIERCEHLNREILDLARQAGDEALAIRALGGIGSALQSRGDHAQARVFFGEALALARPRHDKWLTSVVTGNLGLALVPEDPVQALALLKESLALAYEIGHRLLTVRRLEDLASLQAQAEVTAQLLGASEVLRDAFGLKRGSSSEAMVSATAVIARERLGSAAFEAAWNQGRAMTPGEAVALALGRSAPAPTAHAGRPGGLTDREVQIVWEIVNGLTNRQIAEKLEISQRTVDAHVQNILNKLGVEKRTQIAVWASRHLKNPPPLK
jgi:predicted ATPase/DNA-binding CsgD family transcriptional regulator